MPTRHLGGGLTRRALAAATILQKECRTCANHWAASPNQAFRWERGGGVRDRVGENEHKATNYSYSCFGHEHGNFRLYVSAVFRISIYADSNGVHYTATDGNIRVVTNRNSLSANSDTCSPDSNTHNSTCRYKWYGKVYRHKDGKHYCIRWNGSRQYDHGAGCNKELQRYLWR